MRYLTRKEVQALGHTPHLIHNDLVYSFRHSQTKEIVGYDSNGYSAAFLIIDMAMFEPASPIKGGVKL
jgi:hypothetical protein